MGNPCSKPRLEEAGVIPYEMMSLDPSAHLFTNAGVPAAGLLTELLIAAGADIVAVDAGVRSALADALDRGLERIPEVLRRASLWVIVPVRRRPLAVPPTVKCLWR